MKKIVVLGGTGFVGRYVLKWLADQPWAKIFWVKRPEAPLPGIQNLPPPKQIEDLAAIDINWLADADVIIDLVSRGRGRMTERRDINLRVRPHLRMIDGLINSGSDAHYIFLSSGGAIYGNTPAAVLDEKTFCLPQTEYGLEKLLIETSLLSAAQKAFQVSVLRVMNAYGVGQVMKPGFGVIPTLVSALRSGHAFKVFGSGNMQRDYVNVVDVQRAIAATIDAGGAGVVNIGTGHGTSINELIALVHELSAHRLNIEYVKADDNEPLYSRIDISRAKEVLDWEPKVSLREGLMLILKEADLHTTSPNV